MLKFLGCSISISIVIGMMVLKIHFTFDLLLNLISVEIAYFYNVPTMTDLSLFSVFMTPKVIMSV